MNLTTRFLIGSTLVALALAGDAQAITVELPVCEYEDGSDLIDGYCAWIDPDTGNAYVVKATG